jgi:GT2 family glycosyltransferase
MKSAFDTGLDFLRTGNLPAARAWLDRARRLEPLDASVALALGSVMIRQADPDAVAFHAQILQAAILNEALCGLAGAYWMAGERLQAAETRATSLRLFAQRFTANQVAALNAYAAGAGAVGWCGLTSGQSVVTIYVTDTSCGAVTATQDGTVIWHRRDGESAGAACTIELPPGWEAGHILKVEAERGFFLGGEISIRDIVRVEGVVASWDGGMEGWAWCPNDPDYMPRLTLRETGGAFIQTVEAANPAEGLRHWRPLARPRRFAVPTASFAATDRMIDVIGRDGRQVYGAPIDPSAWLRSAAFAARAHAADNACRAVPAGLRLAIPATVKGLPPSSTDPAKICSVIIPVYGAREVTLRCVQLAIDTRASWSRVVVVNDASDDEDLLAALAVWEASDEITLLHHATNAGFPRAVNTGLRHCAGDDVVLLNSDTLLPAFWLQRLRRAAYSAPDIGTVTPFSNDATLLSYPIPNQANPAPDLDQTRRIDGFASQLTLAPIEIPTAIGFCMFIKWRCLEDLGGMREDLFAQGYGEENDFCLRARHLGWRNVAAPNVFVGHIGAQSFGGAHAHLRDRNLRIINTLHPGYGDLISDFIRNDPLAAARRALDRLMWNAARNGRPAVLLITHGRLGGVRKHVIDRARALRALGKRPICLWPAPGRDGTKDCVLGDGPEGGTPNLRFALPAELDLLAEVLQDDTVQHAEVHSLVGHDHAVLEICRRLNVPYDIFIHDYAWFCPRITLMTGHHRYCNEPDLAACADCVADDGQEIEEDIAIAALVARSGMQLAEAASVIAPTIDTALRIRRHFPHIDPAVRPWENDAAPRARRIATAGIPCRVCIPGAIGLQKGYDVLLGCVRDAARRCLQMEFVVVGYTCDDARLLRSGPVSITGEYHEDEAVDLIGRQNADIAFVPSLWPETWCYTLSQAWQSGLDVVAFDIGSQAERIRSAGRGCLLPLGTPARDINDVLLALWGADAADRHTPLPRHVPGDTLPV